MIWNPVTIVEKGSAGFAVPLKVYTEAGAKVEAYNAEGDTLTQIVPESGLANITLPTPGKWVVRAESEGVVLPVKTVDVPASYDLSFNFHEPRLPAPYVEVSYIENPNNDYFTSVNYVLPPTAGKMVIRGEFIDLTKSGYLTGYHYEYQRVPYSTGQITRNFVVNGLGYSTSFGLYYVMGTDQAGSSSDTRAYFPVSINEFDVEIDWLNGTMTYNDTVKNITSQGGQRANPSASALFAMVFVQNVQTRYQGTVTQSTTYPSVLNYRLKSLQIYDSNNDLALDLVPCKNGSGVVGLFDLIGFKYYTSVGQAFTAGPEV